MGVEFGAEGEHAVDDEDGVGRHGDACGRVVDLGDGVDAAQGDASGAGRSSGCEEEVVDCFEVERVAVVAGAGLAVVAVGVGPGGV